MDEKLPYGSEWPVDVDILGTWLCEVDTGGEVAFDTRVDLKNTGREVGSHRDLDCGNMVGDQVYCASRSFYTPRTLTLADSTPAAISNTPANA